MCSRGVERLDQQSDLMLPCPSNPLYVPTGQPVIANPEEAETYKRQIERVSGGLMRCCLRSAPSLRKGRRSKIT